MRLHAVFHQTGVDAEIMCGVADDLLDHDRERLPRLVRDSPPAWFLAESAGRGHPHGRLVSAGVGVHEHAAVDLDDEQSFRQRQMRRQPTGVGDRAR